ncbi:hypothetical protein FRACYDRAFT_244486 [Fragilariopsis cylindrus CCMP1102]|uniref:Uncharacterized protein n=1 Tax=Fragilariopsis cylindrus CCMP1102 TaxID=635003 RepID=A0A1E7F275_9STRA|nr:hypothetical protein FRACYDRAFT_244486 [Fragilariopsis cylindrus CCMP1102]|eukprot:OEU12227.1 hypothetical protein FRACYDRAFT_244486 [Fragilariopsis cylindrus CCMP1102]
MTSPVVVEDDHGGVSGGQSSSSPSSAASSSSTSSVSSSWWWWWWRWLYSMPSSLCFYSYCCCCLTSNPTLKLLSTPWEFFVSIDQSALWQKHVAWAKPKGNELKRYISSQYSSRMVLLSLLLATEMSVFFNSAPELVQLRNSLSIIGVDNNNNSDNSHQQHNNLLPFWIGFVLLLNICVTILGILATFTTWNIVSAVSDTNAHCLLRSSLGQYVTTLSPRLVVCSLYLFLLWFLLFVVELILGGGGGGDSGNNFNNNNNDEQQHNNNNNKTMSMSNMIRNIFTFTKHHIYILLLWSCFLFGVVTLFFCIVVPLSAFGRLVLHTGAMSEQPVLSEQLELDLLASGLHAGLVIRAHHSQRRYGANNTNTATGVTPIDKQCASKDDNNNNNNNDKYYYDDNYNYSYMTQCNITMNQNHTDDGTILNDGNVDVDVDVDDGTSSLVFTKSSMKLPPVLSSSRLSVSTSSSSIGGGGGDNIGFLDAGMNTDIDSGARFDPVTTMPTKGATSSTSAGSTTILNLSMSAKEFNDLIDNTIDTSSVFTATEAAAVAPVTTMSPKRNRIGKVTTVKEVGFNGNNGNSNVAIVGGSNDVGDDNNNNNQTESSLAIHSSSNNCHIPNKNNNDNNNDVGIPPPYPNVAPGNTRNNNTTNHHHRHHHRSATMTSTATSSTRHHRRVSSSRFLLQEWAQENSVRDLYGAAPPADLPQEIVWTDGSDDDNDIGSDDNNNHNEAYTSRFWNPASSSSSHHWLLSPFSSPATGDINNKGSNNSSDNNNGHSSHTRVSSQNGGDRDRSHNHANDRSTVSNNNNNNNNGRVDPLQQPLLPNLSADRRQQHHTTAATTTRVASDGDEEMGGSPSLLLGEDLLGAPSLERHRQFQDNPKVSIAGYYIDEYNSAMLAAMSKGFLDKIFRAEEATPYIVGQLTGFTEEDVVFDSNKERVVTILH